MPFVLRYDDPGPANGTYFVGYRGDMPAFGGTLAQAHQFATRSEVAATLASHWSIGSCVVEPTGADAALSKPAPRGKRRKRG